jgi:mannose-6-phosphate isomerase-like protein (cupin superfamily)
MLSINKTSFGIKRVFKFGSFFNFEVLDFYTRGYFHKHKESEYVFVISGKGSLYINDAISVLKTGMLRKIKSGDSHYMCPDDNQKLKLLIFYY